MKKYFFILVLLLLLSGCSFNNEDNSRLTNDKQINPVPEQINNPEYATKKSENKQMKKRALR